MSGNGLTPQESRIARLASGDFHQARLVASNFVRSAGFGANTIGDQRNHTIILSGTPKHGFAQVPARYPFGVKLKLKAPLSVNTSIKMSDPTLNCLRSARAWELENMQ
jgi:hypothetical protein